MSPVHVVLRSPAEGIPAASLRGVLDIVIDGINITAQAGRTQGLNLLAELGHALGALLRGRASRSTAQLATDGESWELGLEIDGPEVLLSVIRAGPCPEVAVLEKRVLLDELREALEAALEQTLSGRVPVGHRAVLEAARDQLIQKIAKAKPLSRGLVQDRGLIDPTGNLCLQADAAFRLGEAFEEIDEPRVERADLHALLVAGRFTISSGHRELSLKNCQLFLVAERLVWLAEDALDSWQAARPLFRRLHVEGVRLGMRRGPGDGPVALSIALLSSEGAPEKQMTLPDLEPTAFVETIAAYAEALCDRFALHDRQQSKNLRINALIECCEVLKSRLAELKVDDAKTNEEPENFKSYGLPKVELSAKGTWSEGGEMRFMPRWVAAVPHVDLRSTFLYREQLIVGSAREVAALEPRTGDIRWRIQSERAATVATPVGIARIHADGRIRLHDLADGEVRAVTRLQPRSGGGAAGALVNTPGLPRMLLVAEGDRSITAVDLTTGEVRWRHSANRPARFRLRRAGRLVLVSGGDAALLALDVITGEIAWKVRDRLPFSGDIAVHGDSAIALSTSSVGAARLHHIDLWSGQQRWTAYLDDQPVFGENPMISGNSVIVPTQDRRGVGAAAYQLESGELLWEHEPGLCATATAWLALDDRIIANSASGTLLCLDSRQGEAIFNHVFSRQVEVDQPRRLAPILSNGALFVPQSQVEVIRPTDGALIGSVPCDLIPDLMRVDDSCNVYIAEESGHIAAYSVAPQLRLIS